MNHITFATLDKDIGNQFADGLALRDCVKVALALCRADNQEARFAERGRLFQNRSCHGDIIIEREGLD